MQVSAESVIMLVSDDIEDGGDPAECVDPDPEIEAEAAGEEGKLEDAAVEGQRRFRVSARPHHPRGIRLIQGGLGCASRKGRS